MSVSILVSAALAMALGSAGATNRALGERDAAGSLREYIQHYLLSHGDDPEAERSATVTVTKVRLSVRDPQVHCVCHQWWLVRERRMSHADHFEAGWTI
jgi:hypothetical protein